MRLGVTYNVFNGAELLKPSILTVRLLSHHIVVVYSVKSITGEDAPKWLVPLLNGLKKDGLVDTLIEVVHPLFSDSLKIQREKRMKYELGRKRCMEMGCTHHMGRDVDEFFDTGQLRNVLDLFEHKDMVLCPLYDYINQPTTRARQTSPLHVTAFHKAGLHYEPKKCPVLMDMSRTVVSKSVKVLKENQLVMHHMTGVRYNQVERDRKFQGHSHFNLTGKGNRDKFIENITNPSAQSFVIVPDRFGVLDYWQKEFGRIYGGQDHGFNDHDTSKTSSGDERSESVGRPS